MVCTSWTIFIDDITEGNQKTEKIYTYLVSNVDGSIDLEVHKVDK